MGELGDLQKAYRYGFIFRNKGTMKRKNIFIGLELGYRRLVYCVMKTIDPHHQFSNSILLFVMTIFMLNSFLHPFFHASCSSYRSVQIETRQITELPQDCASESDSVCPICQGVFKNLDIPESIFIPSIVSGILELVLKQPENSFRRLYPPSARAPPLS